MNMIFLTFVFPLIGFLLLSFSRGRWSENLSALVGVGSIGLSAIVAAYVIWQFNVAPPEGGHYTLVLWQWMSVEGFKPNFALYVDGLSITMLGVVVGVGFLIHLFASWYMRGEAGYSRFFAYTNLFIASMLFLVLGDNLLFLYFGWEGVGLCSYLLIGFYYSNRNNGNAALKAFIVTRIGDVFMAIGLFILFQQVGTLNIQELLVLAPQKFQVGDFWITLATLMLLGGAVGKSAQLPLQTWLADAMAGPTPVSALIHAATMVTAGVYLIARTHGLFTLAPEILHLVGLVGGVTLVLAGFAALVQTDIKRILAYSTMSQIGYMFLALGVGAWDGAIFHLMTHAFFKALLFLAAGSVIIGMHHDQDIRHMGGLRKYMPITWITFLVGSLALIGTPFFSGFYSKDSIIEAVAASHLPGAGFASFAVTASVFVTALYSFRLYFLVFHGKERFRDLPEHDEHGHDGGHHAALEPHESPWVVTLPLILLAIPSAVIGYFAIQPLLFGGFFNGAITVDTAAHPAMADLAEHFHGPLLMTLHAFASLPLWLAAAGVAVAYYSYMVNLAFPATMERMFKPVYTLLDHKYYMDWINEHI
ncbi:NADH-quinone oxidoreductase subunit L, partial [Pseudomonas sp.]|uniref:NADH-quinone oxidoreductase subunit L n=1 Tax=Pseudomonas sp. TaxID=306 RepID=UPI00261B6B2B